MRLTLWLPLSLGLLLGLGTLAGCRDAPSARQGGPEAEAAGPAQAADPAEAGTTARKRRLPRFEDPTTGVRLDAPAEGWVFLDLEGAQALDPQAVAGLVGGEDCVGLVRMGPQPEGPLLPLIDARIPTLGLEGARVSWKEPVLYAGVTAMRAQLKGRRGDSAITTRLTLAVLPAEGRDRRLYEIRAESSHAFHVEARRCLDRVTAAFDVIPIRPAEPAEPVAP